MQQLERDNMTELSAENQGEKDKREPTRDSRSSRSQVKPNLPPLMIDGLEQVRDPNC
jgi:hypothetical protein